MTNINLCDKIWYISQKKRIEKNTKQKKYIVRLSEEERENLKKLVQTGKTAAYKRLHAQILLKADVSEHGDGWKDIKISEALDISRRTTCTTKISRTWFRCSYQ